MAIACLRLVTLRPLLPERSLPRFISCISCPTSSEAFGLYRRPLVFLRDDPVVRRDADFLLRDPLDALFRAVRPVDFRAVLFLFADLRPVLRDELADFFRDVFFVAAMTFSLLPYSDASANHRVAYANVYRHIDRRT
jgi:hypothetical protein